MGVKPVTLAKAADIRRLLTDWPGGLMKIEMYTKDHCPYCTHARALLRQYGVEIIEYDVTHDATRVSEMVDRSLGQWTVPQIFFDNVPMGGCDDLRILHHRNLLQQMIEQNSAIEIPLAAVNDPDLGLKNRC